jgi:hypothetical protein
MGEVMQRKFEILRGVIPQDTIGMLSDYYHFMFFLRKDFVYREENDGKGKPDVVLPYSKAYYADPLAETILMRVRKLVSEATGIESIQPTYSFVRLYEKGNYLAPHTDRPACQYSVTLPLMQTTPWTIYADGNAIDLEPGDVLLYKGEEVQHWRDPLESGYQIQAHLHYIDYSDPNYKEYIFDGRTTVGMEHPNNA